MQLGMHSENHATLATFARRESTGMLCNLQYTSGKDTFYLLSICSMAIRKKKTTGLHCKTKKLSSLQCRRSRQRPSLPSRAHSDDSIGNWQCTKNASEDLAPTKNIILQWCSSSAVVQQCIQCCSEKSFQLKCLLAL